MQHKNPSTSSGQASSEHDLDKTIKKLKKSEEELSEKCLDLEGKYIRALADYQNLLKRTAQEKTELAKFANEQLLHKILPVYDNLKISMLHINEAAKDDWLTGIKHVIRQFKEVLESIGIEEIKTKGEKFNHHTMEAISKEPTDDEKLDDIVVHELKSGYKLNGKVISVARVVVGEFKE